MGSDFSKMCHGSGDGDSICKGSAAEAMRLQEEVSTQMAKQVGEDNWARELWKPLAVVSIQLGVMMSCWSDEDKQKACPSARATGAPCWRWRPASSLSPLCPCDSVSLKADPFGEISVLLPALTTVLYLAAVLVGPRLMRDREPFNIKAYMLSCESPP